MKSERPAASRLKREGWQVGLPLVLLLAINTIVLEVSDVVATSGFIANVGAQAIIWLWLVGTVITLFCSAAYALVVDRIARVVLVSWLLGGFAFLYLLLQLLFMYGVPGWLLYPVLYILSDQQHVIFPLAFWALANDLISTGESKRLFPRIAAGGTLGNMLGNAIAAGSAILFARSGGQPFQLLGMGSLLSLVGVVLTLQTLRKHRIRARQARTEGLEIRETVQTGADVIRNVPLFRYLTLAMLLVGLAFTIIEFHFLASLERAVTQEPLAFQTFYGAYKVLLVGVTFGVQSLFSGRLLMRLGHQNSFLLLPAVLLAAVACAFALPGVIGAAGGRFMARLTQWSVDEPARKSVQGLIPDERRGRVSAFLDSYLYGTATIIGCLLLGGLLLLVKLGWLSQDFVTGMALTIAGIAAAGAIWATIRLRTVYETSLLNWRLSRTRRKSVLDGIDF